MLTFTDKFGNESIYESIIQDCLEHYYIATLEKSLNSSVLKINKEFYCEILSLYQNVTKENISQFTKKIQIFFNKNMNNIANLKIDKHTLIENVTVLRSINEVVKSDNLPEKHRNGEPFLNLTSGRIMAKKTGNDLEESIKISQSYIGCIIENKVAEYVEKASIYYSPDPVALCR